MQSWIAKEEEERNEKNIEKMFRRNPKKNGAH